MKAVLLVPRRAHPERDKLWEWCRARWERYFPDLEIHEGHHDEGPFNRSAAINTAARGDWDVGIVIDADVFLRESQVRAAIAGALAGRVTWGHRRWRGLHEDHTRRVIRHGLDFGPEIDRDDMDVLVERTNPRSWSCCIAIPRATWDDMGGFDERFVGWGYEDMAFKSLVTSLYPWGYVDGDVYHLWHPRSEERIVKGQPAITASPEYVMNARLGRRYMVAAYRDHGIGDDHGPIPDDLRARHVRNLTLDDAKLALTSRHLKLPDWSDWWPTLEELREGAKLHHAGPRATVTVIVHTGGLPENWPARREYLRRSLTSLHDQVHGPIVQRVVYDCWGDEAIRAEIEAMLPDGFYVVGPDPETVKAWFAPGQPDWKPYQGSTAAMFGYLDKRAKGSYVYQTEDDFLHERPVDLGPMIETLDRDPHLVQVALLRDPYPSEAAKGGILGHPVERFTPAGRNGDSRLEHRLFFTCNPSLFRKSLTARRWPSGRHSETLFGQALFRDPKLRAAFWGTGEPWITHLGEVRAGTGY